MPSQKAFEVLKTNGYIHATSDWNPEDQLPPKFTGKFPLPDPRTHRSNPKVFIFTNQLASRPERIATHQAHDDRDSFTSSPSGARGEYGISIRGQSRLNSVPLGYSGEFNHGPDGRSAQDGNYFGGHNTGPGNYGSGFSYDEGGHNLGAGGYRGGFNFGPQPGGYIPGPGGGYGGGFDSGPGGYSTQGGNFGHNFSGYHPGSGVYGDYYGGGYRQGVGYGMNSNMQPFSTIPQPHPYMRRPLAPAPAPAPASAPAPATLPPIVPHPPAPTARTLDRRDASMTVYRNGTWTTPAPEEDSKDPGLLALANRTSEAPSSGSGRGGRSGQGHSAGGNRSNRDGRGRDDNSQQRSHRQGVMGSRISKPTSNWRRR
jgi:hypothetical protein